MLRHTLNSGSARVFSTLDLTRSAQERGEEPEPLFNARALNYAVFFKEAAADIQNNPRKGKEGEVIDTILYFPYDRDRIFDGGAAVSLNDHRFETIVKEFSNSFGVETANSGRDDKMVLKVLRETPSLDPFLLKASFERYAMRVPPAYLRITPEEWEEIKDHVRRKIMPMVEFGFTGQDSGGADANKKRIDEMVDRIWSGTDISALHPLLMAFRISLDRADDVVFSWKGVTFFEFRYLGKAKDIENFARWLKDHSKPLDVLPSAQMRLIDHDIGSVKDKLRRSWLTVNQVLRTYDVSYRKLFVTKESTSEFQQFLMGINQTYVILGRELNKIDHSLEIFKKAVSGEFRRPIKAAPLAELLETVRGIL